MNFFETTVTMQARAEVVSCLIQERLSEGERVKKFEKSLEDKFGMRNAVAVNSGTSALHLALILAGVGEGDEVILPAQTFLATAAPIVWLKAKPVFADIGMDGNISWKYVANYMTSRVKAVIAVSWGGNPCDLQDLARLCLHNGISLIQDNAHALGATYKYMGEHFDLSHFGYSCYSFQAIKALTTGDGGLLTCQSPSDYQRAKNLRWFGIDRDNDLPDETGERQFNLEEVGYKYHMNDYSAALGLGNLVGFKERQGRRKEIADRYDAIPSSADIEGVRKKEGCSYWLYDVLVERRDDFLKAMKDRGIPVSVVHVGIDKHGVFGGLQDLPVQRYWDEHHVCLPIHAGLTDEDVDKVVEGVLAGW